MESTRFALTRLPGRFLSREEEAELARQMQAGSRAARDTLVESQLPWLRSLAKAYARPGFPLDDLLQIGALELLKCLATFVPSSGRLSTYIVRPVKWRLYRHIRCCRLIYRPYVKMPSRAQAHDQARSVGGLPDDAARLLPDGREAPDELVAAAEQAEQERGRLFDAISRLRPSYQRVIRRRLAGHTLKQIAKDERMTRECIRQKESRALREIREMLVGCT